MTSTGPAWWVVMLPGEYAETSDLYGPFRSEVAAQRVADRWNAAHPAETASVLPIQPADDMA